MRDFNLKKHQQQQQQKLLKGDSIIKTQDKIHGSQQTKSTNTQSNGNGSTNANTSTASKPVNDANSHQNLNDNNRMLLKIIDILGELSKKCDNTKKLDDLSNDMKTLLTSTGEIKNLYTILDNTTAQNVQQCSIDNNQQMISLHAKLDHCISNFRKQDNIEYDIVTKSIDDLHCKMDVIISDPRFMCKQNLSESHSNNQNGHNSSHKRNKSIMTDDFEWSFSFNQSMNTVSNTENADLYSLLTSFEQNTWAGLDLLRNKICEQQNTILNIETICKNHDSRDVSRINDSPLASAVTNSI